MTRFALTLTRYAPAQPLPPYSYVPGHDLPHPVNDPAGHLSAREDQPDEPPISPEVVSSLPQDPAPRRRAVAALLAADSRWLHALDLFNQGFYWEAHEAWESFWHALGRTTPEARFVQGLIHLAAACVKIREGKPAGVSSHTRRARELTVEVREANDGGEGDERSGTLGIVPQSLAAVFTELDSYTPQCWHTSRFPVVRVLVAGLQPGG
jgi:hypothetical protein